MIPKVDKGNSTKHILLNISNISSKKKKNKKLLGSYTVNSDIQVRRSYKN